MIWIWCMHEWYYLWLVYFHLYLNSLSKENNVLDFAPSCLYKTYFRWKTKYLDFEKHISIFRINVNSPYTFFRTNNSVVPSGAKNRKVSKEKKHKNLTVFAKMPRLKRFFFSAKLSSSNVKTVVLTRAPENVDENHDISFEAPFALRLAVHIDMSFFRCFCL